MEVSEINKKVRGEKSIRVAGKIYKLIKIKDIVSDKGERFVKYRVESDGELYWLEVHEDPVLLYLWQEIDFIPSLPIKDTLTYCGETYRQVDSGVSNTIAGDCIAWWDFQRGDKMISLGQDTKTEEWDNWSGIVLALADFE